MSDIEWVLIIGVLGGLVHDILYGGFTAPILDKSSKPTMLKIGSIGDWVLGAGAAFVTYATAYATTAPSSSIQLGLLAFTSGIGGSAILKAYVNGQSATTSKDAVKATKAYALSYHSGTKGPAPQDESERMVKFLEHLG